MTFEHEDEVLQIALASYDPKELRVQKNYLEEQNFKLRCDCFCTGESLLRQLQQEKQYHAVVLCSQLEDMDRELLVERLLQKKSRPAIIQFDDGRRRNDTILWLDGAENCYYVERTGLKDLLWELYELPGQQAQKLEKQCSDLYKTWGVKKLDINCSYLTSAVCIVCSTSQKLAVRKEILQVVSERFEVSVSAVDSSIRRMADLLEAVDTEAWRAFKRDNGFLDEKPTTGRLIYAIRRQLMGNADL